MDLQSLLMVLLGQLPGRVPVLIALVVGLILVLRQPTLPAAVRRPALLGFGLLLAGNLLGLVAWPLLQAHVLSASLPASTISMTFALLTVPLALVDAAGLVLLGVAIARRAS